ncbi:similar to Saccharomyces cerevisiae YOR092W ECM3 Non-essential protein of unknown function [Maudiozyma saulgeensis]|uniref:Protein ECM3 n=1 Tax=Maudiozyma saulgeensis TaxID=1789683 RepID=A0A1X7R0C3_9SACH|nr:similar to Saccharomyces cerevisiae YOR092W ECM3 Non-essential protein of unknown function [Kazachstania saulgeensis]
MHETLGNVIWIAVKPIIKIYLIIGVGFGLCKMGILTADATRSISDIVLTVLLPSLSFNKIVGNIEDQDIKFVGIICLTSILIFGTGLGCAYIIKKTLPVPKAWGGGILAGGMFPNISDLPIAYLQTLDQSTMFTTEEGNKGVANVIIFLAMFLFCVFNLGGFRLIENDFNYKDEESGVRDSEMSSVISPLASIREEDESPIGIHHNDLSSSSSLSGKSRSVVNGEKNGFNSGSVTPSEVNHDQEKNMVTKLGAGDSSSLSNQNLDDSTTEDLGDMPMAAVNNDLHSVQSSIATSVDSQASAGDYNRELGVPAARRTMSQPVAYTEDDNGSMGRRQTYSQYSLNSELALTPVRSLDKRDFPTEGLDDIVREYSNVDQYGGRRASVVASLQNEDASNDQASHVSSLQRIRSSNLTKILTSDATVSKKDIEESGGSLPKCIRKFPLTPFIVFFLKNCLRPCSMAVIAALTIAFIPWVKALFVTSSNTPNIKQAPDNQPALSFFMDFTSYVGAASVPFGLILLGATLGRLKIKKLYPGFWKSAVLLVFLRQCVMPIFGVLWADRLVKAGWLDREKDEMLLFVMTINWALPTMTTLIYFTASYTPVDCEDPIQMECTAFFLMLQYPLLIVSLPFVVTYYLKVYLKK